jgi:hypothetical protein
MWVLALGPKGIFETMILAEFSNFRRRKFPFLRLRGCGSWWPDSLVTKQRTAADLRATINVPK